MEELKFDQVKVHIVKISRNSAEIENFRKSLDPVDSENANRFIRDSDKNRSILSKYFLRKFLSHYLKTDFNELKISFTKFGKPYLNNNNLKFNYSHSGDLILFAFCYYNEVGIDTEEIRDIPEFDELSQNYFSQYELSYYRKLTNQEAKKKFFYKIWTRKEALLKAVGSGITIDLKSFSVLNADTNEDNSITLGIFENDWIISDLILEEDYSSSIAFNSKDKKDILIFDENFSLIKKI